jgi:hypothetical protein
MKEVVHVWRLTNRSVGKLLPRIACRMLAHMVSSSSCERNWSSYSFVYSKSRNRLYSFRIDDMVYVYTNSRVFNQNVTFMDEAVTEYYKQTILSEDSNSDGPHDLLNKYDDVPDVRTADAKVNGVFTKDENTQG